MQEYTAVHENEQTERLFLFGTIAATIVNQAQRSKPLKKACSPADVFPVLKGIKAPAKRQPKPAPSDDVSKFDLYMLGYRERERLKQAKSRKSPFKL